MAVERITPEEAEARLRSRAGYIYIDVRTAQEFAQGHVRGAVNVPLLIDSSDGAGLQANPDFLLDVKDEVTRDDNVIVGCQRGSLSLRAAQILEQDGFRHVVDMRGGYDGEMASSGRITFPGWARLGLPTTTD